MLLKRCVVAREMNRNDNSGVSSLNMVFPHLFLHVVTDMVSTTGPALSCCGDGVEVRGALVAIALCCVLSRSERPNGALNVHVW